MTEEFTFPIEPSLPKMIIVTAASSFRCHDLNFKIFVYTGKKKELSIRRLRGNQKEYD